jgi:hypothetical protein
MVCFQDLILAEKSAPAPPQFSFVGATGDLFETILGSSGLTLFMSRLANILGKWLFPRLPRDVRQRRMNNLLTVLFISLIVMGGIVLAILLMEKVR